jgi:hypothetical protein
VVDQCSEANLDLPLRSPSAPNLLQDLSRRHLGNPLRWVCRMRWIRLPSPWLHLLGSRARSAFRSSLTARMDMAYDNLSCQIVLEMGTAHRPDSPVM